MVESASLEKEARLRDMNEQVGSLKRAYKQADPAVKGLVWKQWLDAYYAARTQWERWGYAEADLDHLAPFKIERYVL